MLKRPLLTLAIVGAVVAGSASLATPRALASSDSVEATGINVSDTAQDWQGTCYSPDGRYAATAKIYLQKRQGDRLDGDWYSWEAALITLSVGDLTGKTDPDTTVYYRNYRYDGQQDDPIEGVGDAVGEIKPGNNGQQSIVPYDLIPWKLNGGMNAQWWYNRGARTWYFDTYRIAFAFNGDTHGPDIEGADCGIDFGYGFPVLSAPTQRPIRTTPPPVGPQNLPDISTARSELASLKVAPEASMTGYSRTLFGGWATGSDGCSVQREVLKRDGVGVTLGAKPDCTPTAGSWFGPYDASYFASYDGSKISVDHTVPLGEAWRSGADAWSAAKRSQFYNELRWPELAMSSTSANSSKGDQDPSTWEPRGMYRCNYARSWIQVKAQYDLTLQQSEKDALSSELDSCT